MNIKELKLGQKIQFELGEKTFSSTYMGKFDFLHCFDTKYKTLPKVTIVNPNTKDAASIVIANFELLQKYGMTKEEITAILYHEEGHILSTEQKNKKGLDKEFDADDYASHFVSNKTIISALEKTKNIIINESSKKETIPKGLENLAKRIAKIREKEQDMDR